MRPLEEQTDLHSGPIRKLSEISHQRTRMHAKETFKSGQKLAQSETGLRDHQDTEISRDHRHAYFTSCPINEKFTDKFETCAEKFLTSLRSAPL